MTPRRYQQAKTLFFEICDLPADQRQARLEALDDTQVRLEVESLLRMEDEETSHTGGSGHALDLPAGMPERIGRYRLIRVLGTGGMGVTYEAEQEFPQRRVALKLLRTAAMSGDAQRRFRREAEMLGRLQHPAVARLYEAGQAETERGTEHYIAMERVHGRTLDAHARHHNLGRRARLELFCRICRGVEAAHAVGIIHRDLKPANVLVTDDGEPKIVDFGVARFADPAQSGTRLTSAGQMIGTLAYMSPEQIRPGSAPQDVRLDIYALGATLFELLSGRPPVNLAGLDLLEAVDKLKDTEPKKLGALDTSLRGDLETIVAKALERDPARRYGSVAELRADIERYLRRQPITARPASLVYRVRKFTSRHRGMVASAALLFGTLCIALIVVGTLWQQAQRAREQTRAALRRSQSLLAFFRRDLLGGLEAGRLGYDAKLIELLDEAAPRIDERFADAPAVAGALHGEVADMYASLGRTDAQLRHASAALRLLTDSLGPEARDTLAAELRLGEALADAQQLEGYLAHAETAARRALRTFGPQDRLTLRARVTQGDALQMLGRYEQAEAILRPVIAIYRQQYGPDEVELYRALNVLGALLMAQKRYADAEPVVAEELDGARRLRPVGHPQIVAALNNYAAILMFLDRPEQAEPLLREAIKACSVSFSPEHWRVAVIRGNLARVLNATGRPDEALEQTRLAMTSLRAAFPEPTMFHLKTLSQAARARLLLGQWDETTAALDELLGAAIRMRADLHPVVGVLESASDRLLEHGQAAGLAELCRRAREQMARSDESFVRAALLESRCLRALGCEAQARELLASLERPTDASLADRLDAERAALP